MLNLIKSKRVKNMRPDGGDQGWLNSIYLWEMFDIGHEYNLMAITEQTMGHRKFMENATILHYAGGGRDFLGKCPTTKPWLTACKKWKNYRQKFI